MAETTVLDDRPLVSPRYTGRLLQGVFLILFLMATGILLVISPENVINRTYPVALLLVALASVLPFLPAFRVPRYRPWMLTMPALDFIAFLILRLEGTGGVTNPMVMILSLPAVWIGLTRSRTALVVFVPIVYSVIVPDIVLVSRRALDQSDADRAIMLIIVFPLAMLFAAGAAFAMATILSRRQESLATEQWERARAASEADRLRQLMESVVDTLDVGVIVIDPAGDLLLMNRVLRQSPELTAGGADPWESFQAIRAFQEDRVTPIPLEDSTIARVMRGERVTQRLVWVGPPSGRQTALSVSGSAVHTASGEHLANVMVVNNVTDMMVAIEARDAFIGTVSHELRTPLTTVSGFLELILERQEHLDPEIVHWLRVMERNVQRQQVLVRDLLAAAGARNAPIALEMVNADLAEVAREAAAAVRKEAAAKQMIVRVSGSAVEGRFDPIRMAQVAENLMTNAVRYSPEGSRVDVTVADDGHDLHLRVRDRGAGIAPEDQEMLFDRFFRSSEARASATRGVGLGLPIVKAIVDAHGGSIDVESELGVGTTVTVRLPRD